MFQFIADVIVPVRERKGCQQSRTKSLVLLPSSEAVREPAQESLLRTLETA